MFWGPTEMQIAIMVTIGATACDGRLASLCLYDKEGGNRNSINGVFVQHRLLKHVPRYQVVVSHGIDDARHSRDRLS